MNEGWFIIYTFIKSNRSKFLVIGIVLMFLGLFISAGIGIVAGFSAATMQYAFLYGIFPFGGLIFLWGYFIDLYESFKPLLIISLVIVISLDVVFIIFTFITGLNFEYFVGPSAIVASIVKKNKKVRSRSN